MGGRRPNRRAVKIHRNYEIGEAARVLGVARGSVRRWIKSGDLPALTDRKPYLILGADLVAFLDNRSKPKQTCRLEECFCFSCKAPRAPALGEMEYHPVSRHSGNLRALCDECLTVMHKRFSAARLDALRAKVAVTIVGASATLSDMALSSSNDHLDKDT